MRAGGHPEDDNFGPALAGLVYLAWAAMSAKRKCLATTVSSCSCRPLLPSNECLLTACVNTVCTQVRPNAFPMTMKAAVSFLAAPGVQ